MGWTPKTIGSFVTAFILVPTWPSSSAYGGEGETGLKAEALMERIADLEARNRAILERVASLEARIDAMSESRAKCDPGSAALAVASTAAPSSPSTASAPQESRAILAEANKSAVSFYGFIRADVIYDDSRPNSIQRPTFILSEDPALGPGSGGGFSFHPRLTRLGFNYDGPVLSELGGARISGKIETDFQNGGRESRAIARYRQAYLKLSWDHSSILLGQTWDIISPLRPTVNNDTLMWNAGNMGDRRMQFRYTYQPDNGFSLQAGLALTGAVDPQDLDGNGLRDGEDASVPHLQARLAYRSPQGRAAVGFSSHYAREETEAFFGGRNRFKSYSFGFDYDLKLTSVLSLRGESWYGSNLSDFRGGIGQAINILSGEEITSRGGWIELGLKAPRVYSFSTGFTIDDPRNGEVPVGGRTENRALYLTNRFQLAKPFLVGVDYLHWRTDFFGLEKGTDNRFNAYFIYNF